MQGSSREVEILHVAWRGSMLKIIKRWLGLEDDQFNPLLPHGQCEAKLGYSMGMRITCGARTNLNTAGYWHCVKHPVPLGTPQRENTRLGV